MVAIMRDVQRETPGNLPALGENTRIKTDLKTIVSVIGVLLAATVWCTKVYIQIGAQGDDISKLREMNQALTAQVTQMSADLKTLSDQVRELRAAVIPDHAPAAMMYSGSAQYGSRRTP
jgi:hypothetical protein